MTDKAIWLQTNFCCSYFINHHYLLNVVMFMQIKITIFYETNCVNDLKLAIGHRNKIGMKDL